MSKKYRIFFIGKFTKFHDEEYIAKSFEMLGHTIFRCESSLSSKDIGSNMDRFKPELILYTKWDRPKELDKTVAKFQREGTKTICWLFDLYWGYSREYQVHTKNFFKSDYVFTTDGGHDNEWKQAGINHHTVRQGIYHGECFIFPLEKPENNVVFVGSESPIYEERNLTMARLEKTFTLFKWVGRKDTDETRGIELNKLYAKSKVVVGDSFPSPNYWSNRVVETLGRGGFLIHREVEGLKEEYPHLVTYNGEADLKNKITYYLRHENERRELVEKNFEWVKNNYTTEKQCQRLLSFIS